MGFWSYGIRSFATATNYIPTKEEEELVVCRLQEKEDKEAFRQSVQARRNQLQAAQQREAEQRRQAAIEAARPESPEEHQYHLKRCNQVQNWPQGSKERESFNQYCMQLWAAAPHSQCAALPCGDKCFEPSFYICEKGEVRSR